MKYLGAVLVVVCAFVVGGVATAGQEDRVTICHYPTSEVGQYITVSSSAFTSPHSTHGDCLLEDSVYVYGADGDQPIGCSCDWDTSPEPSAVEPHR